MGGRGERPVVVKHAESISWLSLNRPPLNLVTSELIAQLAYALDEAEARSETRVVVLTGTGERAFCAGADLGEEGRGGSDDRKVRFRQTARDVVDRIETFPKPTVAGIRGWCIGGGTALALPCDIRIASSTARFRTADVYLGIVPSWGMGFVRMVHYLGRNHAMDMLLLGEDVDAQRAHQMGLVTKVVADADYQRELGNVASRLAGAAPVAVRAVKEAIRAQYRDGYDRAAVLEDHWAGIVSETWDAKEGALAFKERRPPIFRGE